LGQDKGYPSTNIDSFRPELDEYTDVQDNHKKLVREMGAASTVILRNINNALPLKPSRTKLAIIGEDAGPNRG
jgi:beta-glucosidase